MADPHPPRIRVVADANHQAMTRVWLDERELVGVIDISVGVSMDGRHPQTVTLVVAPLSVDWSTVPARGWSRPTASEEIAGA